MERWPILLLGHKTPLSSWLKCVVCAVEIHIWVVWNPNVRAFKTSLAVRSLSWQFPRPAHRVDKRVVEAQCAWLKHSVTRVSCSSWIMEKLWFVGKHVFLCLDWWWSGRRRAKDLGASIPNPLPILGIGSYDHVLFLTCMRQPKATGLEFVRPARRFDPQK